MNCEEVQSKLSEYFENLPDPETMASIGDHLSGCDRCRTEAEELTQTLQLVKALPEVEPPGGFATRVMAHINKPASELRFWHRFYYPFHIKLPIHAAAVILVSILAVYVYQKEPQQRRLKIGEAEFDRLGQDKRDAPAAPEFRASVPPAERNEALEKRQAPTAPASAPPAVATGPLAKKTKEKAPSDRPDASPAAFLGSSQENSSVPGEFPGNRGLPGSATELRDKVGTVPVPSEGGRGAMSGVGAATAGTGAKRGTSTAATKRESTSGNALDRSAAPQGGVAPKSPLMREDRADYELLIRLRSATLEEKSSAEALGSRELEDASAFVLSPEQKSNLDHARQRATETGQGQTLWLDIPRSQWLRFKREIAAFAQIESESAAGTQARDEVAKSSVPLRVRVTIFPALSAPSAPRRP